MSKENILTNHRNVKSSEKQKLLKKMKIKVTCLNCGARFMAREMSDGSLEAVKKSGECSCMAPLEPHYTKKQLSDLNQSASVNL